MSRQEPVLRMEEAVAMATKQPLELGMEAAPPRAMKGLPHELTRDSGCGGARKGLLHTEVVLKNYFFGKSSPKDDLTTNMSCKHSDRGMSDPAGGFLAAVTNCHRPSGLSTCVSHSYGGPKSNNKVSAGMAPSEAHLLSLKGTAFSLCPHILIPAS